MIYILSWTTKKHQKTLSRPLHSKLKKIQGLFKDLHRNLRTFQGLSLKFKDFSRLCEPCVCVGSLTNHNDDDNKNVTKKKLCRCVTLINIERWQIAFSSWFHHCAYYVGSPVTLLPWQLEKAINFGVWSLIGTEQATNIIAIITVTSVNCDKETKKVMKYPPLMCFLGTL